MPMDVFELLKVSQYSSCEIADALSKLGVKNGGYIPDINMLSPTVDPTTAKICGPAYTVKMVPASDNASPTPDQHFVDAAERGSVIVISGPPQAKSALWGGLMTAGAQARATIGVVIDGRCRDLAEHREACFPVFARGHSIVGQGGHTRPSALNVPITIKPIPTPGYGFGGENGEEFEAVQVRSGDIIMGDMDGVVCIPVELVEAVVEKCRIGREIDARCMVDIRAGKGVQASFKLHRGK